MRATMMLYAYYTKNPVAYHDAMMPIHGFVYTRALLAILGTMGPTTSFVENVNSKDVYAHAVFGAALLSVGHCSGGVNTIFGYVLLVHAVGKLNLYTRLRYDNFAKQQRQVPRHIDFLRFVGLFYFEDDLDTHKDNTDPKIGYLPVDKLGRFYAAFN
ncbi:hypothetical protein BBP40_003328 [Aspergillus hancockii]|nr:hypothetical protein BBP40_003328 [Aspergillus hancockii]